MRLTEADSGAGGGLGAEAVRARAETRPCGERREGATEPRHPQHGGFSAPRRAGPSAGHLRWGLQYHHFTSSPFEQEGRS